MAIRLTGTDTNGVAADANGDWWLTLVGQVVANNSIAFSFETYTDVTYSVQGTVISSASTAIYSSHAAGSAALATVLIAETGVVQAEQFGVRLGGDYNQISNEGSVTSAGGSSADALRINGNRGEIKNLGTAQGSSSAMQIDGDDGIIINHGLAIGNANSVFLNGDSGQVDNYGTMQGKSVGVLIVGTDARLFNAGLITAGMNAVDVANNAGETAIVVNTGTIQSTTEAGRAILGSFGDERIENEGSILGSVGLRHGNDSYQSMAGNLTGPLEMEDGDDLAVLGDGALESVFDMDGGSGSDTLDLSNFSHAIWADLTYADTQIWTRDGNDLMPATGSWRRIVDLDGVENIIGTVGIDLMRGDAQDNTFGYVGNALITGLDSIDGRGGTDTVDFSRAGFAVWVDLATSAAWTQDDANATDSPTEASPWRQIATVANIENLIGTDRVDYMAGTGGDNVFFYRGTTEFKGTDVIVGRGGSDTIDLSSFANGVWVNLAYAGAEIWTQDDGDATDATGTWRALADVASVENVIGTDHRDLLLGDSAANIIDGGKGDDELYGRAGNDTFVFTGNTFGKDKIFDFSANDAEKIDLSGVSEITDFSDLLNSHLGLDNGNLTIGIGFDHRMHLIGWTLADIGVGLSISADDFIF